MGLLDGARVIGVHRFVEQGLFELTGRWSIESATGPDPSGLADFFATQSAIHAWRLSEWESRSPSAADPPETVDSRGSDPVGSDRAGWDRALAVADSAVTARSRLACWYQVLAVHLAARYRRHRAMTCPVSDAGVARWLGLAEGDVLDGVVQGAVVATGCGMPEEPGRSAADVSEVVAACLVPLIELGY